MNQVPIIKIFAFVGPDGAGKSTAVKREAEKYRKKNQKVICIYSPQEFFEFKKMIKDWRNLQKKLKEDIIILMDRFVPICSFAYQSIPKPWDKIDYRKWFNLITPSPDIELTIVNLSNVNPTIMAERIIKRGDELLDRFKTNQLEELTNFLSMIATRYNNLINSFQYIVNNFLQINNIHFIK